MKRYAVLKPIVLGFSRPQDQFDVLIYPEDNTTLESDGHTIWLIIDNERHESITTANAIENWLNEGKILEIS